MYQLSNILAAAGSAETGASGEIQGVATLDVVIIAAYILGVVGIGLYAGKLMKKKSSTGDSKDYFLAGGTLKWPMIGLALFATNISCVHLVSLAQSGFDSGLLNGNFEWMAAFTLILLSLFFAPFYIKSKVATLPDFLEKRYNRPCRDMLAVFSLVSAVIIHIGFSFLTGGIVLRDIFGVDIYVAIIAIAALTALYTIVGGLLAVVLTEAIQTVILIAGASIITWIAYDKMGGWNAMVTSLEMTGDTEKLSMLRPHGDESGMPWYAIMLGYPVLGIWYWCADQTIVQRVLGAKDENHARVGPIFAGIIKIIPVFIFVLPGLLAYTLASTGKLDLTALTDAEGVVDSKGIYTAMITQLLPIGIKGLVIAALLAALMSTVSGALNSISTLTAFDLFKRFKPETPDTQLVFIGRIAAAVALVLAIALVPMLIKAPSIFNALNSIIAHIAAPVTCVFLLGVFWKKANAFSAQWTMVIGAAAGTTAYFTDASAGIAGGFMMMAFYLFVFCVVVQVALTLISGQKVPQSSADLCWDHPLDPVRQPGWSGIGNYKFLSVLLLVIMGVLYYAFR
ncbi:solute:sodium symporter family transporter [Oceaniferula spumae]|uniref:Solute:sodium symporter family transporter n=1 Tax=Oceaniferula spumae TaxID=2979115 RepID=A0AAT9FM35_9BACT